MGHIIVKDLEGNEHKIDAAENLSIMEIISDSSLPIKAACYGSCSCSTCHVYVDEKWLDKLTPQSSEEEETIDMVLDLQDNSRLSCQIPYNPELDGLTVTLALDTKPD